MNQLAPSVTLLHMTNKKLYNAPSQICRVKYMLKTKAKCNMQLEKWDASIVRFKVFSLHDKSNYLVHVLTNQAGQVRSFSPL